MAGLCAAATGLALATGSNSLSAQEFDRGQFVPGVRLTVGNDPYDIAGSTAAQIRRQLQISGPRSWVQFPSLFTWSYDAEAIPRMNGTPSDQCRFTDFEVTLEFTAVYPRWTAPPESDPPLTEAWAAFEESVQRRWAQDRDDYLERATEAVRRSRGHEDHCPLLAQRFHAELVELLDRRRPLPGNDLPEREVINWPPAGYEHLLSPDASRESQREAQANDASQPDAPAGADEERPTVAIRSGIPRPVTTPAPDLDYAVQTDLRGSRPTGFITGLHHQGSLQLLDAYGALPEEGDALSIDTPVQIPTFTHVLVSTLAVALDAAGLMDLDAPISTYIEGLSPRLGGITTGQLIDHKAGLDNAPPADSTMAWDEVLDGLNDRALFTAPGVLPSYSAYSFGLTTRVLEGVTRMTLEDALEQTLLVPLGMTSTTFGERSAEGVVDGLPITSTSATDVMRFWIAWLGGSISGAGVDLLPGAPAPTLALDGRAFRGGLWLDRPGGVPRLSLGCATDSADSLIQVFPLSGTILLNIGVDGWPRHASTYLLDAVGTALRMGNEVFGPVRLAGVAGFGRRARPCGGIGTSPAYRPVDFGPRAESADWAGRYVNGDWFFALEEDAGMLTSPRNEGGAWQIHHFEGDRHFASVPPEEREGVGFPFRLFRGPDGLRYLMLGDRAYVHEDDR